MAFTKDLKKIFLPHYLINILLCISFVCLRVISPLCYILFPSTGCSLTWREWEILTFVSIIVVFKTKKIGATTMLAYLSAAFMYCKIGNFILYMNADPRMGVVYSILCVLQLLWFPEPSYAGPENVVYFRGPNLKEELLRDKRITWLIAFYAAWSPACAKFAPIFSELSAEYALDNLKFGKVDVARFPQVAKDFYINDSSFSKQLPSLVLFKNGKEFERQPQVDNKGKLISFFFTEDNIKAVFDLNNIYLECKNNPLQSGKKKKSDLEVNESHIKSE